MKEMKTIKFPGDTEPREIVDVKARERLDILEGGTKTVYMTEADIIDSTMISGLDEVYGDACPGHPNYLCTDYIPLAFKENTTIEVRSHFYNGAGVGFYDENKNCLLVVSGLNWNEYGLSSKFCSVLQTLSIVPPAGSKYIRLTAFKGDDVTASDYTEPSDLWVKGSVFNSEVEEQIKALEKEINSIKQEFGVDRAETTVYADNSNVTDNKYVNATAKALSDSDGFFIATLPINFDYNKPITIKSLLAGNMGLLITNSNKDVLLAISGVTAPDYGGASTWGALQEITLDNPEGAAYVIVTFDKNTTNAQQSDLWVKGSITTCNSNFVSCMNQDYTETQKKTARENIGAISAEEVEEMLVNHNIGFDYEAFGLPVLYLDGDISTMTKDDAVDLQYRYKDLSGTASVKWQGSSSIAYPKKNYTVKFDTAFEAVEGWGAQKKYCMKANYIDFTHSRNVVSAKLWGQIVASRETANAELAACPNYGAVDGFPICIVMNGEYYGVYTFNIPKDGWMMNMGNGTQECILCADAHTDSNAFKGEATLDGDFDIEYITDENVTDWARISLNNLINACVNSDGGDLDTTIATMLDWESAIDYYIFAVLLRGADMITKNYLINTYDGTKWFFGAYDLDSTYGLMWDGKRFDPATDEGYKFAGVAGRHRVFDLIRTYKKAELKERYKYLRNTVMSEDNVALTFRNFAGAISRPLLDEDNRKWPGIPNTNANSINQILDWYRLRVATIDAEIESM